MYRRVVLSLTYLLLAGCGGPDGTPVPGPASDAVPAWARVADVQRVEARRLGVPVAFENPQGMRFVLVPSGTFLMGSPPDEPGHEEATETQHEVRLTRAYYLQTTEVTNGQFRRFRPGHRSTGMAKGSLDGDDQPVVQVSFQEALDFVGWLNAQEPGRGDRRPTYRLPTEAEWERACRAGTSTAFWWGNWLSSDMANYDANVTPYDEDHKREARGTTVPVGSLPANAFGLHEVHGNASEWCSDWYDDQDYPPGATIDPLGPPPSGSHLRRGGAYGGENAYMLRAAFRIGVQGEGETREYVGFRVAASLPTK